VLGGTASTYMSVRQQRAALNDIDVATDTVARESIQLIRAAKDIQLDVVQVQQFRRPIVYRTCRRLSALGAHLRSGPVVSVGTRGTLTMTGVEFAVPFNVRAAEQDELHLAFELNETTAARFRSFAERLSIRRAA
jgi:hypothetical protein